MKAVFVLTAALAFASSPFWTSGFGGFDPNLYPNPQIDPPVQPAGYAFSIWGPIYLWLIAHAAYGLLRRADDAGWDGSRWPLVASLVVGTPWISVALVNPPIATLMIWVMLGAALLALLRAPVRDRAWAALPIGLYAGWLTAASFVALGLLGAGYGVLFGETGWAWAALLAALGVGLWVQARVRRVPTYGLAMAWAFAAIAVANLGESLPLTLAAGAAALVMAGAAVRSVMHTEYI